MTPSRSQLTAPEASGARFIDPETLMRIRSLELRARIVVEGFLHGVHRSPVHGFSVEFSEYRQYSPGDDPRHLDWRLFARSDRYYVKRFEDETNLRCYLLVDQSRSMSFGSLAYTKGEYALTAAATLGYFLWSQRDAVGLVTFDDELIEYLPPRYRPGHLHRMMVALSRQGKGRSTDLGEPLERIARTVSKRSLVVLISDLLAPVETLEGPLRQIRSQGHEVIILRVLDPVEESFRFETAALFEDVETGRDLYVEPERARADYLRRFAEHAARLDSLCADLGVDQTRFTTDRPLELALFDFVSSRQRRGRQVSRQGQIRTAERRAGPGGGVAS